MCISVSGYGIGEGFGTHVSIKVHLEQGDFEEYIKWPFMGSIVIQIMAQKEEEPCTKTITYSEDTARRHSEVGLFNELSDGWGYNKFLPHASLEPRYLCDNSLTICFTKVTVREDYRK